MNRSAFSDITNSISQTDQGFEVLSSAFKNKKNNLMFSWKTNSSHSSNHNLKANPEKKPENAEENKDNNNHKNSNGTKGLRQLPGVVDCHTPVKKRAKQTKDTSLLNEYK
jgi:hypothetical protein